MMKAITQDAVAAIAIIATLVLMLAIYAGTPTSIFPNKSSGERIQLFLM